jgi:hypothetical protein
MYKFITIARNINNDTYPMPMYIYQNEENKKYYISRMYPTKSVFQGTKIINNELFYSLEYPQEISENDLKSGKTTYWSMIWEFKITQ